MFLLFAPIIDHSQVDCTATRFGYSVRRVMLQAWRTLANFAKVAIIRRQSWTHSPPTRNISLTAEQDAFVEQMVRSGPYQNASEAVRDAIRGLQ
jgi:hypothetical protein